MSDVKIQFGNGNAQLREGVFRSATPFHPEHAQTVVIDCSDGRYTPADEEFLESTFGHPHADELNIPGGVATLHPLSAASWAEVEVVRTKLNFLVEAHHSVRIIVMAHEDCGHYKTKYPGTAPEALADRQLTDLAAAVRELRSRYPGLECRAFRKRVDDGHIVFDEVVV